MSVFDIPEILRSDDILYHYSKLNTAVEYILPDQKLLFSPRKISKDPIEAIKSFERFDISGLRGNPTEYHIEANSIRDLARTKRSNAKQVCFCMNHTDLVISNMNPSHPYEYYGFLKSRMWERYGDNFEGICLAFSLKDLIKINDGLVNGPVEYLNYNRLEQNAVPFEISEIIKDGIDKYWLQYEKYIERKMFQKHFDYQGENEYRFLSFSKKEKDYLEIKNCLRAIIVSNSISDFMKNALSEYGVIFGVEIIFVRWTAEGINFRTKTKEIAYLKRIENSIKQFKKEEIGKSGL